MKITVTVKSKEKKIYLNDENSLKTKIFLYKKINICRNNKTRNITIKNLVY